MLCYGFWIIGIPIASYSYWVSRLNSSGHYVGTYYCMAAFKVGYVQAISLHNMYCYHVVEQCPDFTLVTAHNLISYVDFLSIFVLVGDPLQLIVQLHYCF